MTTSPFISALPYFTLPKVMRKVSPSTSEILVASFICTGVPPALAFAFATLAFGL